MSKPAPSRPVPVHRVTVDVPRDLLTQIDAEAERFGVTREESIMVRLGDALAAGKARRA